VVHRPYALSIVAFILTACHAGAQPAQDKVMSAVEVRRIETTLSSDDMRGRRDFSPDLDKAAKFIASEFQAIGLQPLPGNKDFDQVYSIIRPKTLAATLIAAGNKLDDKTFVIVSCQSSLRANERSGYKIVYIKKGENLFGSASGFVHSGENMLVIVDTSFAASFGKLAGFKRSLFKSPGTTIFLLGETAPATFSVEADQEISEQALKNVAGILPGSSRPSEYVIFSAHYDHLGVGRPVNGDSIYNGANDDAAGVTAVILLARYFKSIGHNDRSIIFVAFSAEEIGGYGSQYFSRQVDPAKTVAMLNIEMIGTESKWGRNSAYITGYEKSNLGEILQRNLAGSGFTFYPDPYTQENLFYRSDNATLARLGVPAHTISTSKMDNEPNYHQPGDEVGTLDIDNMAMIIKSIAISASSVISGKDTPTRVNTADLQ
ncbi:MAG TPA: M28 family peptidase, partial [Chitinophagaceae bacterium]